MSAAVDDYDTEWIDLLLFGGKVCATCGLKRPKCRTYFTSDTKAEDGLKATCRTWVAARDRLRYQTDPVARAKMAARQKLYRDRKARQMAVAP